MEKKKCNICGLKKPLGNFYDHPNSSDGKSGKCKECAKRVSRENRVKNIEKAREYDRQRSKLPHRIEARKKQHEKFKESDDYSEKRKLYTERYRAKNRKKANARRMVSYHMRKGNLVKKPCEICGNIESEAHHDNYDEPLNVRWLCDRCHKNYHNEKRKQERKNERIHDK